MQFFYRNGFGGATMLQSTDIAHKFLIWDRQVENNKKTRQIDINNKVTFLLSIDRLSDNEDERVKVASFF